jgi:hypothetical protein
VNTKSQELQNKRYIFSGRCALFENVNNIKESIVGLLQIGQQELSDRIILFESYLVILVGVRL